MRGFSFVELSIVLVILGLLTGGILSGQSLIRAAELRSVSTDISRYQTAIFTFRQQYMSLPGDMRNATAFWGAQAGGTADGHDATCIALTHTSPATGVATCNGNGDGNIGLNNTHAHERYRAWQHMANAGLIEGTYTGVRGANPTFTMHDIVGENVPASRLKNVGFSIYSYGPNVVSGPGNFRVTGNTFIIGGQLTTYVNSAATFTPQESWNIDTKLDDGKPGLGRIIIYPKNTTCPTNAVEETAEYNVTLDSTVCTTQVMLDNVP